MKKDELYNAFIEIDDKYISEAAPEEKKTGSGAWLRIAAVAACVALLAAGMLAALPFMLGGNEQPPVVEPPVTEETGENTEDETTKFENFFAHMDPPLWLGECSVPQAIIEIIEDTGESYRKEYKKIKCKVIYSRCTGIYDDRGDPSFKDIDTIYIPNNIADEFLKNSMAFIKVSYLTRTQKDGNIFTISNGIYYPIVEGKLILDDNIRNPFEYTNESIEYISKLDPNEVHYTQEFLPKKPFCNGMSFDEIVEFFKIMDEARNVWMEWRKQAEGYI